MFTTKIVDLIIETLSSPKDLILSNLKWLHEVEYYFMLSLCITMITVPVVSILTHKNKDKKYWNDVINKLGL